MGGGWRRAARKLLHRPVFEGTGSAEEAGEDEEGEDELEVRP